MGYAVLHIMKGNNGNGTGLERHIDRTMKVPNANPELAHKNFYVRATPDLQKCHSVKERSNIPLRERINTRIKDGYTGKTALRKDAVKYISIVTSGSHEDMQQIVDDNKLNTWAHQNFVFMAKQFGAKNIVEFSVHMDERTPHIHCVVVPLTPDGRLSAKEVMGNREKLSELQSQYAERMASFKLNRGIKGSTATHETVKEYYARINDRMNPEFKDLQLAEQYDRLRKENSQLQGIIKDQDKKLNPEKYQDKNNRLSNEL